MKPEVRSLEQMIGDLIVARIPALDKEESIFVRLHKIEATGIWIESHTFNESMLKKFDIPVSLTTLVLFVPFSSIDYIIASIESVTLSETALGLKD